MKDELPGVNIASSIPSDCSPPSSVHARPAAATRLAILVRGVAAVEATIAEPAAAGRGRGGGRGATAERMELDTGTQASEQAEQEDVRRRRRSRATWACGTMAWG